MCEKVHLVSTGESQPNVKAEKLTAPEKIDGEKVQGQKIMSGLPGTSQNAPPALALGQLPTGDSLAWVMLVVIGIILAYASLADRYCLTPACPARAGVHRPTCR